MFNKTHEDFWDWPSILYLIVVHVLYVVLNGWARAPSLTPHIFVEMTLPSCPAKINKLAQSSTSILKEISVLEIESDKSWICHIVEAGNLRVSVANALSKGNPMHLYGRGIPKSKLTKVIHHRKYESPSCNMIRAVHSQSSRTIWFGHAQRGEWTELNWTISSRSAFVLQSVYSRSLK